MRRGGRRFPADDRFELKPRVTSFRSVAPNPPQRATSGASAIVSIVGSASADDLHSHDSFHLRDLDDFFGGRGAVENFELAILEQALHAARQSGLANFIGGGAVESQLAE